MSESKWIKKHKYYIPQFMNVNGCREREREREREKNREREAERDPSWYLLPSQTFLAIGLLRYRNMIKVQDIQ